MFSKGSSRRDAIWPAALSRACWNATHQLQRGDAQNRLHSDTRQHIEAATRQRGA